MTTATWRKTTAIRLHSPPTNWRFLLSLFFPSFGFSQVLSTTRLFGPFFHFCILTADLSETLHPVFAELGRKIQSDFQVSSH
jgi:hypothetical protein